MFPENPENKASGQTMSVSHRRQDAGTIDPPFSWPFPMVPSRLHCRSDNGRDRRACSPSMSCCSGSSTCRWDCSSWSEAGQRLGPRLQLMCWALLSEELEPAPPGLFISLFFFFFASFSVSSDVKHNARKRSSKTDSCCSPPTRIWTSVVYLCSKANS